jgi:glycerate kinase
VLPAATLTWQALALRFALQERSLAAAQASGLSSVAPEQRTPPITKLLGLQKLVSSKPPDQ